MKKRLALLLLPVIICLCSFSAPDWTLIQSNEGGFKMLFPVKPEGSSDTARPESGPIPWKIAIYNANPTTDDNYLYGLSFSDFSSKEISSDFKDKRVDDFLDHVLTRSVTGANGEVVLNDKITFKDFPGRHMKISFAHGKAIMDLKIYLVHSRCYILQLDYLQKKENNPSIDKFFNSFELI